MTTPKQDTPTGSEMQEHQSLVVSSHLLIRELDTNRVIVNKRLS